MVKEWTEEAREVKRACFVAGHHGRLNFDGHPCVDCIAHALARAAGPRGGVEAVIVTAAMKWFEGIRPLVGDIEAVAQSPHVGVNSSFVSIFKACAALYDLRCTDLPDGTCSGCARCAHPTPCPVAACRCAWRWEEGAEA